MRASKGWSQRWYYGDDLNEMISEIIHIDHPMDNLKRNFSEHWDDLRDHPYLDAPMDTSRQSAMESSLCILSLWDELCEVNISSMRMIYRKWPMLDDLGRDDLTWLITVELGPTLFQNQAKKPNIHFSVYFSVFIYFFFPKFFCLIRSQKCVFFYIATILFPHAQSTAFESQQFDTLHISFATRRNKY